MEMGLQELNFKLLKSNIIYYTVFEPKESYQSWQPPHSLQIIPFERIETCPTSYTPESCRKPCKIERTKEKRPYIHKL